MILRHLDINGYHCYKETGFDFAKEVTVLIGKNGTGKSSLLKAICDSLSFIFNSSEKSWGFSSLANGISELGVANIQLREIYHNERMEVADNVTLHGLALFQGIELNWKFCKMSKTNSYVQSSLYKDAYIAFMKKFKETGKLPVLSYYSDRYPHINTKMGKTVKEYLEKDDIFAQNWGYYQWNDFTSCTEIWQKRFIKANNLLMSFTRSLEKLKKEKSSAVTSITQQVKTLKSEIDYVTKYIRLFTDNCYEELSDRSDDIKVVDLVIDGIDEFFIKCIFEDGVIRRWDELPAGYERLFSIIFDIAYRSYILNGSTGEPEGLVIIDEVDLHLHPSLEQDVLQRLKKTFPHIQFIIATHSPLAISNFRQDENNIVIQMERNAANYKHYVLPDIYGMDYNYTLSEVMGTEPRNSYLNSLKEKYIRLARRGKKTSQTQVLETLRSLVSSERFEQLKTELEQSVQEG